MSYKSLRQCVNDLEKTGQLVRVKAEVNPCLEMAEIQRRVFAAAGPAIYFERVKGSSFPAVCNMFGTLSRTEYIFRDVIKMLPRILRLGVDPADIMRRPGFYLNWRTPWLGLCSRPKFTRRAAVMERECLLSDLPQLKCWPEDGGAYLTLPQVYTEDVETPGIFASNLGMYRVQISGGKYIKNTQAGIHYQIHRGIGIHHAKALRKNEKLRVNVFLGGPPAMTLAAVMPLPEGMSELLFAGILNRRRIRVISPGDGRPVISADADFCISGYLESECLMPEGPFGDHLGYYSLTHPFPAMKVERVFHRRDAIFPFTVVGRPPQEDTIFGTFIHEITGSLLAKTLPGVKAVHAVDDAGVHPLLLAVGQERYTPYENIRRPQELLTLANMILGYGQLSLAKYLFLVAGEDDPRLNVRDIPAFFQHVLRRVNWSRDLHFHTRTTMDTLDYTGGTLNQGSKLVVAAAGPVCRELPEFLLEEGLALPEGLGVYAPRVIMPGVLVMSAEKWRDEGQRHDGFCQRFCEAFSETHTINRFPLIILVDEHSRATNSFRDFLWTVFTKSDPASDVYGIGAFYDRKHWGCRGSLVIDARKKSFHPPELEEDPEVTRRVDALAAKGGELHGII
ncbi:MAG: UbiD family decarboxylase [Planctomycetia bacterium]|nr:UbiD family decarboxylase [Planctomycetia bacterium]